MWFKDPYLQSNDLFTSLQKVETIGPRHLAEDEFLHDPINTFACVRVIVKSPQGLSIDHITVDHDVDLYLTGFSRNYSPDNCQLVISGGADRWKKSRDLVEKLVEFFSKKGFYLPGSNIDVLGNMEREVFVFNDRVEIYVSKTLFQTINFI